MAESSKGASPVDSESADDPLAAFGANEWLVDEMYEQYQRDPNSVDKVWWDFFKHNAPGDAANGSTTGNGSTDQARQPEPSKQTAPQRKADPQPAAKAEQKTEPKAEPKTGRHEG